MGINSKRMCGGYKMHDRNVKFIRSFAGKPERRPLKGPSNGWEYHTDNMDLEEIEYECICCFHMAQDINQWRNFTNKTMKDRSPYKTGHY